MAPIKPNQFERPNREPDWCDTVYGKKSASQETSRELFEFALANPPKWMGLAMLARNAIVRPFGLKTELKGEGHFLTRMPVVEDEPDHFETGIDDRHLAFTISVIQEKNSVYLTTNIWFNSFLGKVYLNTVMLGHILATKQMVGRLTSNTKRIIGGFKEALAQ